MSKLPKISLPLLNPAHIGTILEACARAPTGEDLRERIEAVRLAAGDNMQSNDNVLFLQDVGILKPEKGSLRVTPRGEKDLRFVFATGVFDPLRWMKTLFTDASPDLPGRFFFHHGVRFLADAGPQLRAHSCR